MPASVLGSISYFGTYKGDIGQIGRISKPDFRDCDFSSDEQDNQSDTPERYF